MTSRLSFGLLGPTMVTGDSGEISIRGALRRRLLVRLLLSANHPVPIESLREDLWEGELPASAASTLKSHVSLLRQSLGPGRLTYRDGGYVLTVAADELDVTMFERDAADGRAFVRDGDVRGAAAAYGQGVRRWRGRALADAAYASWAQAEAVRLEELRAAVLEGWLEARLALGEAHEVIADAEAAIVEHPLREGLWAKLIVALVRSGRQADSLRAYQRIRTLLADELGIMPSRELVVLEEQILRQELGPSPVEFAKPQRRRTNLAPELTSFIPRPIEMAAIKSRLDSPGLLTLTGVGGTGKTRLALRAAHETSDGFDAVWLCELATVDDPADVVRELASAIGFIDQGGVDLAEMVAQRLAEGTQLAILDNCEHVLDAAADLGRRLLRAAPRLRILATSRSPLRAEGEVVYRVPSMSVPDGVDNLEDFESVRLFVARAKSQQPAFDLDENTRSAVATICTHVDGIPLALELAAARTRTMSVGDIARRTGNRLSLLTGGVRTAPTRQQTLQSLIDWSYDLLDKDEKALFRQLAVFVGGFDSAGAESIADGRAAPEVDELIASLVDKSLLQADTSGSWTRYRMLETVREYASAKLTEEEAAAAGSAHAAYFLELAEEAAPSFSSSGQLEARTRLERDDDNLRAAFSWLITAAEPDMALRFGTAVSKFWNSRGHYGDEMDLLGAALELAPTAAPAIRAEALNAGGYLMFRRGDTAKSQQYLDEALEIARTLSSEYLAADSLRIMAWVADRRGDHDSAVDLASQAVEAATACGDSHLLARAYDVRAAAHHETDPTSARADYAEALRYCRAAGDGLGQASALNNLAVLEMAQGDFRTARGDFNDALAIAESIHDAALLPFLEYGVGLTACLEGDNEPAESAFVSALLAARRTGQRPVVAYALLGIAGTRTAGGSAREAAHLLGASSALFDELGEQPESVEEALRERILTKLSEELGGTLDGALGDGRTMSPEDIVLLACRPTEPRPSDRPEE
jgi:predicted ATPase/DNA-binding SARP family transcriptional activator